MYPLILNYTLHYILYYYLIPIYTIHHALCCIGMMSVVKTLQVIKWEKVVVDRERYSV